MNRASTAARRARWRCFLVIESKDWCGRRLLRRQVGAEILDRYILVRAVGLDVGQRLVDGGPQFRVALADQYARFVEFGAFVPINIFDPGGRLVRLGVQE